MEEDKDDRDAMSLAKRLEGFAAAAKRRWWLLVLLPLLVAGAVYWLVDREPASYTASATVLVTQPSAVSTGQSSDASSGTLLAQSYAPLVTSPPVLGRVIADMQLGWTVQELADRVSVSAQPDSQFIVISTTTSDPQMAANIATATGQAFVSWLAEMQTATPRAGIAALQTRIDQAREDIQQTSSDLAALGNSSDPAIQAQIANLGAELNRQQETYGNLLELQQRLELEELALRNQASLISRAALPGPDRSLDPAYVAGAFVLGLGLAALGVVLLERARPRVRSPRDVRRAVQQPALAVIPRTHRAPVDVLLAAPRSPASQAVRSVSARLRFSAHNGRGLGTVVITSIGSDSNRDLGRTTLAANLGIALAQAGQRVVLVDGDLRRPRLHALVSRGEWTAGLSNLLEQPDGRIEGLLIAGLHPRLRVLLAGTSRRPPDELLACERLPLVMTELRSTSDVIIINAPPLLELTSDALLLAAVADRALVVVRADETHPQALEAGLRDLRRTGVEGCSVVLAGARQGVLA